MPEERRYSQHDRANMLVNGVPHLGRFSRRDPRRNWRNDRICDTFKQELLSRRLIRLVDRECVVNRESVGHQPPNARLSISWFTARNGSDEMRM